MGSLAQRIPPGCPSLASMSFLRLALLPFSWLYGLVLRLRHAGYDLGWLRAKSADVPTITVGNIALGGTGKTPHVELVLRTLLDGQGSDPVPVLATLSRGYGRQGTGFAEVSMESDAASVGDEPLMRMALRWVSLSLIIATGIYVVVFVVPAFAFPLVLDVF